MIQKIDKSTFNINKTEQLIGEINQTEFNEEDEDYDDEYQKNDQEILFEKIENLKGKLVNYKN